MSAGGGDALPGVARRAVEVPAGEQPRAARRRDADALARLILAAPQGGRMTVAQDRSGDVFARRRPFDEAVTLVLDGDADDEVGLAAAVTVATRRATVAGEVLTAGYVFDLAVAPAARRRGLARRMLAAAEDWAAERGAGLLYAHVVGDNLASGAAFAAAGYRHAADVVTRILPAFRARPTPPAGRLAIGDWERAADLLRAAQAGHDLAVPLDGGTLRRRWTTLAGWHDDDAWSTGRTVLGLWDHSRVVRHRPLRLPPEVRALGAAGRVADRLGVAVPTAPSVGGDLRVGYLLGGAGDQRELASLLRAALGRAHERGLEHVVAFHDARRRPRWLRGPLQVAETYHLLVRPLGPPAAERLGERPVWVDPLDM